MEISESCLYNFIFTSNSTSLCSISFLVKMEWFSSSFLISAGITPQQIVIRLFLSPGRCFNQICLTHPNLSLSPIVVVVLIAGGTPWKGRTPLQTGCSWLSERCEFNTTSEITPADQGKSQDVLTYHGPAAQQLLAPWGTFWADILTIW